MLKCWHKDRTKRPKFKEIVEQIEQWISTPLLLTEVASVVRKRFLLSFNFHSFNEELGPNLWEGNILWVGHMQQFWTSIEIIRMSLAS